MNKKKEPHNFANWYRCSRILGGFITGVIIILISFVILLYQIVKKDYELIALFFCVFFLGASFCVLFGYFVFRKDDNEK